MVVGLSWNMLLLYNHIEDNKKTAINDQFDGWFFPAYFNPLTLFQWNHIYISTTTHSTHFGVMKNNNHWGISICFHKSARPIKVF